LNLPEDIKLYIKKKQEEHIIKVKEKKRKQPMSNNEIAFM
jgi:hypothetical protein